jgi:hypothetical protein
MAGGGGNNGKITRVTAIAKPRRILTGTNWVPIIGTTIKNDAIRKKGSKN